MADWIGVDVANHTRFCSFEGCSRPFYGNGWCQLHYNRVRKHGKPEGRAYTRNRDLPCSVEGCDSRRAGRDLCSLHYQRWKRHGHLNLVRVRQQCVVEGCSAFRVARGWCSKHVTRWRRYGSPTARMAGEIVDGKRICAACGEDKPLSEYYRGRPGRCAPCRSEYHATPVRRARRRAWAEQNVEYVREYARRHAAQRRLLVGSAAAIPFTAEQLSLRMAYFGNKCWMCGGAFDHIDHVKPLSRGGPHMLSNLRPACGSCNRSKSAKWEGVAGVIALAA